MVQENHGSLGLTTMPGRVRRAVLGSVPPHLRARAWEVLTMPRFFDEYRLGPQTVRTGARGLDGAFTS